MPFLPFRMHPKNPFFQLPNRRRRLFPPKNSSMYLNDFSKTALSSNVIFDALYRHSLVLQGNNFLKYLKNPQNMTLFTDPSQGIKPMD